MILIFYLKIIVAFSINCFFKCLFSPDHRLCWILEHHQTTKTLRSDKCCLFASIDLLWDCIYVLIKLLASRCFYTNLYITLKLSQGLTPLYYSTLHSSDPYCSEILLNDHAELQIVDHQGMQEIHHVSKTDPSVLSVSNQ